MRRSKKSNRKSISLPYEKSVKEEKSEKSVICLIENVVNWLDRFYFGVSADKNIKSLISAFFHHNVVVVVVSPVDWFDSQIVAISYLPFLLCATICECHTTVQHSIYIKIDFCIAQ